MWLRRMASVLLLALGVLLLGELGTAFASPGSGSTTGRAALWSGSVSTGSGPQSDSPSSSGSSVQFLSASRSVLLSLPPAGSCDPAPTGSTCVYVASTDADLLAVLGVGLTMLVLTSTATLIVMMRR